jgi:hypothetical protein
MALSREKFGRCGRIATEARRHRGRNAAGLAFLNGDDEAISIHPVDP